MSETIDPKVLTKYMREYADQQLQKEAIVDVQKSVIESASDKLGIEKGKFKELADLYFMYEYKPEKFEKVEAKAESVDLIKNLGG